MLIIDTNPVPQKNHIITIGVQALKVTGVIKDRFVIIRRYTKITWMNLCGSIFSSGSLPIWMLAGLIKKQQQAFHRVPLSVTVPLIEAQKPRGVCLHFAFLQEPRYSYNPSKLPLDTILSPAELRRCKLFK
jgi:hypothetical protein